MSGITQNIAFFFSPKLPISRLSYDVILAISGKLKAASLTAAEISIDFAVLPDACLNIFHCFTAICSGHRSSSVSNNISTGDSNVSSSSIVAAFSIINIIVSKFCSSYGASCIRYNINAESSAISLFSQNGSDCCAFLGVVFCIKFDISFITSSSVRIYTNGLYPSECDGLIRLNTLTSYPRCNNRGAVARNISPLGSAITNEVLHCIMLGLA